MTTLSKLMTSAAAATLIAGGAAAQTMDGGTATDRGDVTGVIDDSFDAAPDAQSPVDSAETRQGNELLEGQDASPPQSSTEVPTPDTGTAGMGPETDHAIGTVSEALARSEAVTVFGSDGMPIGALRSVGHSESGMAELSITLDPALETDARRVTYRGTAEVDADGRLILPLNTAEFTSRIMAQTGGAG